VIEVKTVKHERNGGAGDVCKTMATIPKSAMVGKLVVLRHASILTEIKS
jgi:hypothetical protein